MQIYDCSQLIRIFQSKEEASVQVAQSIFDAQDACRKKNRQCVVGLATGNTPQLVYEAMIRAYRLKRSFSDLICFNLDEYYPIAKNDRNSYHTYMYNQLFRHIDVPSANITIPRGDLEIEDTARFCADMENKIHQVGGIDVQILGIGENGHIGFNEPGSDFNSRTRLVELAPSTRLNAATAFGGIESVPRFAVTMGINTILSARKIILLAFGKRKAGAVKRLLCGPVSKDLPASVLRQHPNCEIIMDEQCAAHCFETNS